MGIDIFLNVHFLFLNLISEISQGSDIIIIFHMHSNPFEDMKGFMPRKTAVYMKHTHTYMCMESFQTQSKALYNENNYLGDNDVST